MMPGASFAPCSCNHRAHAICLQYGAVEGVLKIPRAECSDNLNNFESAEIGGVAHRRSPVAAPHWKMQQLGFSPQNFHDGIAIIGANRMLQFVRRSTRGDPMLERGPIRKTVFARDDELRVAQSKGRRRNVGIIRCVEFWMSPTNPVERIGLGGAPLLQQVARLAFGNIEMGPLRQPS